MKLILVLATLLISSATFACTDFTGEYQTEVQTYYSISQNGCESMDVIDETGSQQMIFDGVERILADYDVVVDDQIIAHITVSLSSKMVGPKWVYTEKDDYIFRDGSKETEVKWAEVSFNKDTDLETVLHNADGSIETYVDVRYKD